MDGKRDGRCTFQLALCINNRDPRRAQCSPSQLDTFEVKVPNPRQLRDDADSSNLAMLESAAGQGGFGVTVLRDGAVVFNGQPNDDLDSCGQPIAIAVPLNDATTRGTRRLKVRVSTPSADSNANVTLTCLP